MSWSDPEFGTIAGLLTAEFGVTFPPARRVFAEAAIRRARSARPRARAQPDELRPAAGGRTVATARAHR